MKTEIVPSSAVLPTLKREVGQSVKESAFFACLDRSGIGISFAFTPELVLPLATPTIFVECRIIGRPACLRSLSL